MHSRRVNQGRVRYLPFTTILDSVDILFLTAYILWLVVGIAGTSAFFAQLLSPYFSLIRLVSFSMLVLHELMGMKTNKVGGIIGALLLFILAILSLSGGKVTLFEVLSFAFCARNVDFSKLCRVTLAIEVPFVVFSVFGSLYGVIPNYSFWDGFSFHYALGFLSLSYLAHYLLNISVAVSQIGIQRYIHKFVFIAAVPVFVAVYLQTDSRVSLAVCVAFSVYMLFQQTVDGFIERHRFILKVVLVVQIALPVISVLLMVCFDPSSTFWSDLNRLLSNRLQLASQAYSNYGIGLYGSDIEWVGWGLTYAGEEPVGEYNFVDCAYLRILFDYGIVVFVGFVALSVALCIVLHKQRKYSLLIAFTLTSASLFIDSQSLQIQFNSLLLLFGALFSRRLGDTDAAND